MGAVPNIGFMSFAGRCVARGGCQKGRLAGKGLNTSYWGLVGNKGLDYLEVSRLNLGRRSLRRDVLGAKGRPSRNLHNLSPGFV